VSDLREQLRAAMNGDAGGTPEPQAPEAPEAAVQAAPEAAQAAEAPEAAGGPERDEQGRFKAKNTDVEPTEGAGAPAAAAPAPEEPAKPVEEEPQTGAIRIPPSLPAAVKAQWSDLKPEVQQAFSKLEESVQTAKAEWGRKGERLNRYDEILAPHLDKWAMRGLDAYTGIQALVAAQNTLDADPVKGIIEIARSYGVTPAHLAQAFGLSQTSAPQPGAEGHPAPTAMPDLSAALQPLAQQVQTLQQQLQQSQQASEAAEIAKARAQVEAFANDPANLYFENVRDRVAVLLETKQAETLADAYQMAIWADPTVRPLLLDQQAKEAQRAAQEAAARQAAENAKRQKAQAAQHAGGSVTGAPTPGAQAPAAPHGNLRETLQAAMREHAQQV
jgi:hypothetical protein